VRNSKRLSGGRYVSSGGSLELEWDQPFENHSALLRYLVLVTSADGSWRTEINRSHTQASASVPGAPRGVRLQIEVNAANSARRWARLGKVVALLVTEPPTPQSVHVRELFNEPRVAGECCLRAIFEQFVDAQVGAPDTVAYKACLSTASPSSSNESGNASGITNGAPQCRNISGLAITVCSGEAHQVDEVSDWGSVALPQRLESAGGARGLIGNSVRPVSRPRAAGTRFRPVAVGRVLYYFWRKWFIRE